MKLQKIVFWPTLSAGSRARLRKLCTLKFKNIEKGGKGGIQDVCSLYIYTHQSKCISIYRSHLICRCFKDFKNLHFKKIFLILKGEERARGYLLIGMQCTMLIHIYVNYGACRLAVEKLGFGAKLLSYRLLGTVTHVSNMSILLNI